MEMICANSFLTDNDTGEDLTENIMVAYVTVPELPEPLDPVYTISREGLEVLH